jgi:hypothetical protein
VTQSSEDPTYDVDWYISPKSIHTNKDVHHLVNTAVGGIRNKTFKLHFSNFNVDNSVPNVITGIEVILKTRRNGRVFDDIIELSRGGHTISENKTSYETDGYDHLKVNDIMIYGGRGDIWGLDTLATRSLVTDPEFGITLRFQAHPHFPHRSGMQVDSLQICFYSE